MKLLNLLSRIALLLLCAAAFVGLTGIYARSVRIPLPSPGWQAMRRHRPSSPQVGEFPEFLGEGLIVALFLLAGRITLRLRLSPAPRNEGQPILLDLRGRRNRAIAGGPADTA
jgi:hypothetical protein